MKKLTTKIVYSALKKFAKAVLKKHRPFVIGITGSVGKTTTKEAIYKVLSEEFGDNVRTSMGNMNTEIGLPLTVLGYEHMPNKFFWPLFLMLAWIRSFKSKYPKYIILEMGVDKPGDMDYFMDFIKPNISIVTALTLAHMANFKSLQEMQKEKLKIFENQNSPKVKIYNGDDSYFQKTPILDGFEYSTTNTQADCFAQDIEVTKNGSKYSVQYGKEKFEIDNKLIGTQMVGASLAAISVGKILKIDSNKIIKAVNSLEPVNGRMRILKGIEGITIIDDTYNSSPAAVKAAIMTLSTINNFDKKVAILGNMNELGKYESKAHKEVAKFAKDKVGLCVFVGPNAGIMKESYGEKNVIAFKNKEKLILEIDKVIESGDLVLIKASQNGNYFEEVVKQILHEGVDPNKVLVRQSKFWLKKKGIN